MIRFFYYSMWDVCPQILVFLLYSYFVSRSLPHTHNGPHRQWMKDAEEVAPYCSESDDFDDEAREVYKDQGAALPYTKGFHLICQLVAAMNPDDLDAMDESVPFTKFTLDNLLGVVSNEETYRHYFDCFVQAQRARPVEVDEKSGRHKQSDTIKKNVQWNYHEFLSATGSANRLPSVQQVLQQIKAASS
jgi:hypothetical protein